MKWQCQRNRLAKPRSAQAKLRSGAEAKRASVAWCTQRIEIVPKARCALSRLQPSAALSGLDMARR